MRNKIRATILWRYLFKAALLWFILAQWSIVLAAVPTARFTVKEFIVEGENPLSGKETSKALEPYIGEHEGLERLEDASKALQDLLYQKGYTFHRVIVPPQRATEGVIKLQIITFQIDKVTVEGNKYYPEDNILSSLPILRSGWTPNTREIARSLMIANEHPTKSLSVFLKESETPGHIDARVETKDSRPYQFFSSYSNTGDRDTGHTRLSVGYQQSNLFNLDHTMTLSFTTSPGYWSDVQQYGGYYRIPFYGMGAGLSMFYTYSKVEQGTVADFFDVSGKGTFYGASFDYALWPMKDYNHRLNFGIQDKLFENDTSFSSTPIGIDVRSRPLSLSYSGRWEKTKYNAGLYVEYVRNLSSGGDNNPYAYQSNRAGADPHWHAIRYGGHLDYSLLRDYLLRLRFTGQWADEPLISGEQIGMGGVRSIRGFEERETSGDRGQQINIEVWTPPIAHATRLLWFVDLGRRDLDAPIPGYVKRGSLGSVGMGVRWQWKYNIILSIDGAYVINGIDTTGAGDGKIHFNLYWRF